MKKIDKFELFMMGAGLAGIWGYLSTPIWGFMSVFVIALISLAEGQKISGTFLGLKFKCLIAGGFIGYVVLNEILYFLQIVVFGDGVAMFMRKDVTTGIDEETVAETILKCNSEYSHYCWGWVMKID